MKEFIITESDLSIDNAEELIRCKDCRYYRIYTDKLGTTHFCDYFTTSCNGYEVEYDDYCSRALR